MGKFFKIIVKRSNDRWSARFEAIPQIEFSGLWRYEAIRRLLDYFGNERFDEEATVAVKSATTPTHLELLVPILNNRKIPDHR